MDIQSRTNLTAAYALNNAGVAIPSWTLATNVDITPTSAEFKTLCEDIFNHVITTHTTIKTLKDSLPNLTTATIKTLVDDIQTKTNLLSERAQIEVTMLKSTYNPLDPQIINNVNNYANIGDYNSARLIYITKTLPTLSV